MSAASTVRVGLPMIENCSGDYSATGSFGASSAAASAASSP
jgi:hypothetical protein